MIYIIYMRYNLSNLMIFTYIIYMRYDLYWAGQACNLFAPGGGHAAPRCTPFILTHSILILIWQGIGVEHDYYYYYYHQYYYYYYFYYFYYNSIILEEATQRGPDGGSAPDSAPLWMLLPTMSRMVLGFRGLGFRGLGVQGLGFRVQGLVSKYLSIATSIK